MKIIDVCEFDSYWKGVSGEKPFDPSVDALVREIIEAVRKNGDDAVRGFAGRFDKSSPENLEVPAEKAFAALAALRQNESELAAALELAADHIRRFSLLQRAQFADFETQLEDGLFTGQRVIPVERAAIYVPGGRYPLISSVLMGMIPAFTAGVEEVLFASPPLEDGVPDRRILAAAALAAEAVSTNAAGAITAKTGRAPAPFRIFAMGGAQAIAALALGTETVPQAGVVAGPGNKYVASAKRLLFGETGIDFIAGPTDVLVITGEASAVPEYIAADMCAQAEHDGDARARALLPSRDAAEALVSALEKQLAALPETSALTARASLEAGGLIVVYHSKEEAIQIANAIAPEHLELQVENPDEWLGGPGSFLKNFGSLFIGPLSAEVLGDYSSGLNHTLPTSGSARFSGGLSVRHFLKTVTTLRCLPGKGFEEARKAAECLGRAEGLFAHARAAALRGSSL